MNPWWVNGVGLSSTNASMRGEAAPRTEDSAAANASNVWMKEGTDIPTPCTARLNLSAPAENVRPHLLNKPFASQKHNIESKYANHAREDNKEDF